MKRNLLLALERRKIIQPPLWLTDNTQYLVQMGSRAYGIETDDSDIDLYGWTIPPIEHLLPHTIGEIRGFGRQLQRFEQYTEDHIFVGSNEYDISIYNVAKFFQLCMENNPNMIDALFVPPECVLFSTPIGEAVRFERQKFLHKGCYHKFLGYAHSQMKKIKNKNPQGKRKAIVDKFGFDTKYASHLYRLANECEQILRTGDLDLKESSDYMRYIRSGNVSLESLEDWFEAKKIELESLYQSSPLRHSPDENFIKWLLERTIRRFHGHLSSFKFGCRTNKAV